MKASDLSSELTGFSPESVTILPTYKCNAACGNCCFQSNPSIQDAMTLSDVKNVIESVRADLPKVRLVVFSGGEATLLKHVLMEAIRFAKDCNFGTRLVSNGGWGSTVKSAQKTASDLRNAGLDELNLSTGDEHQKFVPVRSIGQAALAAVKNKIRTLVSVEGHHTAEFSASDLDEDPSISEILVNPELNKYFMKITNVWMEFDRSSSYELYARRSYQGCENIFTNLAVNPYGELFSCCGLTMEYIPQLRLQWQKGRSLFEAYNAQFTDLLKLWIWLDGTQRILDLICEVSGSELPQAEHACEVCHKLFSDAELNRKFAELAWQRRVDILLRARTKAKFLGMEVTST